MINEGDFIELEYVGIVKETNSIFDETKKPIIIPVGKGLLVRFLDKKLVNLEEGKEYIFEFKPEEAFGNKNPNLIRIIPVKEFYRNGIRPVPGLVVNIDGILGTVLTVSSGRVIVDFNHPLAGKHIIYKVKIKRKVTDLKEKLIGFLEYLFNIDMKDKVEIKENERKIILKLKDLVRNKESLEKLLKEVIPEIKDHQIELE